LFVLVSIAAIPSYRTGNWQWAELPPVENLTQIRQLRETGLEIPGWQTLEQQTLRLGGHKWSVQTLEGDYPKPVQLLLLPQNGPQSQPQVEWVDIDGYMRQRFIQQWQTDSYTKLPFTVKPALVDELEGISASSASTAKVKARFFRAWTQQQTFAIVQWYARPEGGHPVPSRWFWLDQLAQLRQERVPWVAVCLQIPTEPLGELEASQSIAESLSKKVQAALMAGPLAKAPNQE
jgi:cyanoexosortase B-associated protein